MLILTIPFSVASGDAFPYRAELLSLASGVILCTLLLANFALRLFAPRKAHEKRSKPYVDAEIVLLERVIASIHADSRFTGSVKVDPDEAHEGDGAPADPAAALEAPLQLTRHDDIDALLPEEVDEPATAIVMKRYADRLVELIPYAGPEAAERARILAARIEELYQASDAIADALQDIEEDEETDADGITAHMMALNMVREAVIDIQDQALTRELECIKGMRRAGELSPAHARDLRNDVYVQQMVEG